MWEKRLERSKQKAREDHQDVPIDPVVLEMERRNQEYRSKRQSKIAERQNRAQHEIEKKKERDAAHFNDLLNEKGPMWKLTKTAEDRAKLVCY